MTRLTDLATHDRLDLLRWHQSYAGRRYMVAEMEVIKEMGDGQDFLVSPEADSKVVEVIVHRGDSYAVSSDICKLLSVATPSCPNHAFTPADVPSLKGFVWFEDEMVVPDRKGKNLAYGAMGWQVFQEGILLVTWTDPLSPNDSFRDETLKQIAENGGMANPAVKATYNTGRRLMLPIVSALWAWDTPIPPDGADGIANYDNLRLFLTFLRFIAEPWAEAAKERPGRSAEKRAVRKGVIPTTNVVRLRKRRTAAGEPTGEGREYDHRWMVGGHWRNQWYPSINDHRPRYILPYVKGPEGTPLVVKERIFQVDR